MLKGLIDRIRKKSLQDDQVVLGFDGIWGKLEKIGENYERQMQIESQNVRNWEHYLLVDQIIGRCTFGCHTIH